MPAQAAAIKRKAEVDGGDYEPTLAAATKNLGHSVEIRIRDNGTGIPPEVKEKLFNPSSPPSQLAKAPDLAFPSAMTSLSSSMAGL